MFWFCGRSGIVTYDGSWRGFTQRATDAPRVVLSELTFSLCTAALTSTGKEASHHYHKCHRSCQNIHAGTMHGGYWLWLCLPQVALHFLFHPTMARREINKRHNKICWHGVCGGEWEELYERRKTLSLGLTAMNLRKKKGHKMQNGQVQSSTFWAKAMLATHNTMQKSTFTSWTWTRWSLSQLSSSAKCKILQQLLFLC